MARAIYRAVGIMLIIFTLTLVYTKTSLRRYLRFWPTKIPESSYEARVAAWQEYLSLAEKKEKRKRLPDVVGIGVKKCGTDAVISFLSYHPFIKTPANVETFFFNRQYKKGEEFYRNLMPVVADHEIVMEKTPAYFDAPPANLPERIRHTVPDAKLILVVCDPVKRSFSDYTHERARYKISSKANALAKYPTFDSYLNVYLDRIQSRMVGEEREMRYRHFFNYYSDHASTMLSTGFYSLFLPRWTELFDPKKMLILNGEDVLNNPGLQMEKLQEFLGVPKLLLAGDFVRNPLTGLFCVRPWWHGYDFEAEKKNKPGWHKKLNCLVDTKGRTRHSKGSVNATGEHLRALKKLYGRFNKDLLKLTGIDYVY